jgi:uncharacterized protein YjgD (DUF1641 family)
MATNSRHRKDHKKKLAARKNRLAQEKVQAQKYQKEFIMNLIKQEQEKGLFDNTPNINSIDGSGPIIEGPAI